MPPSSHEPSFAKSQNWWNGLVHAFRHGSSCAGGGGGGGGGNGGAGPPEPDSIPTPGRHHRMYVPGKSPE